MRVCVADDHASVRAALHHLLTMDLGVEEVIEAGSGEEAVAAAQNGTVSLVLMDIHMPGGGGIKATQQIRERFPRVRVVALTAARDSRSVASMIAAGADSYLVKTAPPRELRESLEAILDGQLVLAPEVLPLVVNELARRLRTEQERADALDALDRTKRDFVSVVSDQLRNPLTAITGYTKTLRTGWGRVDEQTKQEFLERIDDQAERLERRIEQILTVARLSAGEGTAGTGFALDGIVQESVDRCTAQLDGRDLDVRVEPVEVVADRRAMSEVLLALLDNAIVHANGAISVRVRTEGGEGVIEITDEGPGMDESTVSTALDEPFTPGDPSDARAEGGMGLSLYIARRVVENAGGRLELDSDVGRGTTARVCLPVAGESADG